MQPYHQPPGYGPVPMYAPVPRPSGAVPLGLGVIGAGLAAVAFLVAAIMTIVIHRASTDRSESDALGIVLVVETGVVTGLLLIFALGLILLRRDAGRSGIVWIGAAALPWTLVVAIAMGAGAYDNREVLSDDFVRLSIITGIACGIASLVGLTMAMICLGIPPGRRWLAAKVLADAQRAWPPVTLLAAPKRFTLSMVFGVGGCLALLVMTPFATVSSDGSVEAMVTWSVVLVALVAGPQALGLWGARRAREGRRHGANVARAAGVFVLYGLEIFMVLGAYDVLAGLTEDAVLPGSAVVALAVLFTCVVILGMVQWVAGLAALADPRSEQFLRAGGA